jgi:acetate kinase
MAQPILVVNAGSSSVKFSIFDVAGDGALAVRVNGQLDEIGPSSRLQVTNASGKALADAPVDAGDHERAIAVIHDWFSTHIGMRAGVMAVGHRIVHGGEAYSEPVLIDDAVVDGLQALVPLAPLHQPQQIAAINAMARVAPGVPQVACFDTAFHRAQPPLAQAFALPPDITAKGVHRYGFHGLSYEYIVSALPRVAPDCANGKVIVAHLGNGASMCAIDGGRSVATTMGLTALDGLPMGTRCGTLDPGVILYLMQHEAMDVRAVETLLYERSGLLGVSGISSDMRTLLASATPSAKRAVDLFVYRIGREIGSLVAALGGLDALVFTGGIGEHAAPICARVCSDAAWIGVTLDEDANARDGPRISSPGARVSAWVVPTDENLMVARHTARVVDAARRRA